MNLTKKKPFQPSHLELFRLVKDKGGPPKGKGTVAFWKSVLEDWKRRYSKTNFKHWKSVQMAYDKMISRLEGKKEYSDIT